MTIPDHSPLTETARYFLRLGTTGFGGPIALAERMHRDLVTDRRWIAEAQFKEGLAFAQLAPGPLAAQLAMYIGWRRAGLAGTLAAGIAFIAPSFVMVVIAAAAYSRAGGSAWVAGALYGAGAAVIAIIARSGYRLALVSLRRDALLWLVCVTNIAFVVATHAEHVWVIALSALLVWGIRGRKQLSSTTGVSLLIPAGGTINLSSVFWFFLKSGSVVFGSGLAVVPFLYGGVVAEHQWLTDRQFLDSVAFGLLSPGPIVITVAFIGYLIAGIPGALTAAVAVFLPVFLIVSIAAPHVTRITANPATRAAVDGAVAGAVGALLGAVVILASRSLTDWLTWSIAVTCLTVILMSRRVPDVVVLMVAGAVGVVAQSK